MWLVWAADDKAHPDGSVLDSEASGASHTGSARRARPLCLVTIFNTVDWPSALRMSQISIKKLEEKGEERGNWLRFLSAWIQWNAEHLGQDLWLLSWHTGLERVGLSCVQTCYHHPSLRTVITFWPLLCSINAVTTQPDAECSMLRNPNHVSSRRRSPDDGESRALLTCSLFGGDINVISWQVDSLDGITCRWITQDMVSSSGITVMLMLTETLKWHKQSSARRHSLSSWLTGLDVWGEQHKYSLILVEALHWSCWVRLTLSLGADEMTKGISHGDEPQGTWSVCSSRRGLWCVSPSFSSLFWFFSLRPECFPAPVSRCTGHLFSAWKKTAVCHQPCTTQHTCLQWKRSESFNVLKNPNIS